MLRAHDTECVELPSSVSNATTLDRQHYFRIHSTQPSISMLGATTSTALSSNNMLLSEAEPHLLKTSKPPVPSMAELPFQTAFDSEKPMIFDASKCLFCNTISKDTEDNYQHMQKHHGLFIPYRNKLIVDLDSLLEYLHLIIFEYSECIYCHTQRNTAQAAQQHMLGKGHCKFDISQDSEFSEFYDLDGPDNTDSDLEFDSDEERDSQETQLELWRRSDNKPTQVDDASIRLPSGRIVSNRSTPAPRHPSRRPLQPPASSTKPHHHHIQSIPVASQDSSTTPRSGQQQTQQQSRKDAAAAAASTAPPPSETLERHDRRATHLAVQLASMRVNDQRALAHLSAPEQRTVLLYARRETERAKRSENRFRGHMDGLGNLQMKERFVNDVPGGKAHKNRFFAQ